MSVNPSRAIGSRSCNAIPVAIAGVLVLSGCVGASTVGEAPRPTFQEDAVLLANAPDDRSSSTEHGREPLSPESPWPLWACFINLVPSLI